MQIKPTITTPQQHRAVILAAMEMLLQGKMPIKLANSLSSLSAEVHKSIAQEWEMRIYAAENLTLSHDNVVKMLEG